MMKKWLKFWGTRGSCPVSGHEYKRFGGNTCCLELLYGDTRIIFDAGTGIRPLGKKLIREKVKKINLILSHTHWDHLIGFPFFDPLHHKDVEITIWSPKGSDRSCREIFHVLLSQEFFPVDLQNVKARLKFRSIYEHRPLKFGHISIDFHRANHPSLTYCSKIKTPYQTIGYATDDELPTHDLVPFYKGCDLLIHEAQYFSEEYERRRDWGHSSIRAASDFVKSTAPKKWLITHHDPNHTDKDLMRLEQLAKRQTDIPVKCVADGQVIKLK